MTKIWRPLKNRPAEADFFAPLITGRRKISSPPPAGRPFVSFFFFCFLWSAPHPPLAQTVEGPTMPCPLKHSHPVGPLARGNWNEENSSLFGAPDPELGQCSFFFTRKTCLPMPSRRPPRN